MRFGSQTGPPEGSLRRRASPIFLAESTPNRLAAFRHVDDVARGDPAAAIERAIENAVKLQESALEISVATADTVSVLEGGLVGEAMAASALEGLL